MFHPIDKDQRLLSVASDIEVLNAWVEKITLERLKNFLQFSHHDDYFSFHLGNPTQIFPQKICLIILNYFMPNMLWTFGKWCGPHFRAATRYSCKPHYRCTYNASQILVNWTSSLRNEP